MNEEELSKIKEQVRKLNTWADTAQAQYKPHTLAKGVVVAAYEGPANPNPDVSYICELCRQNGEKTPLRKEAHTDGAFFVCDRGHPRLLVPPPYKVKTVKKQRWI